MAYKEKDTKKWTAQWFETDAKGEKKKRRKRGFDTKREKLATKASAGITSKAKTTPKRFFREIKGVDINSYTLGQEISADIFAPGEVVDVTGTTKGKGFQGVIKRHGQSRGPMGHGSHYHRRPGSMGTMLPKRVLKGKKLPGHMGADTVTIQNLEIIEANVAENYILVSGNIPGAKNSLVYIREAVKNSRKEDPKDIILYEEETVVDAVEEVVEEIKEEIQETVEEIKEEAEEFVEDVKEKISED